MSSEGPQIRRRCVVMGEVRSEVLQRIATVTNVRGMEATEVADIVAVSARLVTDDQGNMTSDVFRAVNEVVDLCHGTRSQSQHAVSWRQECMPDPSSSPVL